MRQSGSQQERWERGRIELARAHGLGMLGGFLRTGDLARLDVAVESLTPPLSLLAAGVVFALVGAAILRWELGLWVALGLLAALVLHVAVGIALGRLPFRVVLSLLAAPFYIVWKSVLFLGALVARGAGGWVRTPRNGEQDAAGRCDRWGGCERREFRTGGHVGRAAVGDGAVCFSLCHCVSWRPRIAHLYHFSTDVPLTAACASQEAVG